MSDMKKWLDLMESAVTEKKKSPAGGPPCWKGKKIHPTKPTKMKGGKRVNNCIDAGTKESVEEGATYIGNCTQDETVDNIFGDVSEFARQVELHGDEFEIDNLVVKYDPEEDIHHFYIKESGTSESFERGQRPAKPWMNDPEMQALDPNESPEMQSVQLYSIWKVQGEEALVDAMGISYDEFEQGLEALADKWGRSPDEEIVTHWFIEQWTGAEDHMKESFDPGAEPTMAMEFMAIYKEQGEDELSDAMGLTSGEFDREIADLAIATGMDEESDREELIHQYIEDTIANSDMDMHEASYQQREITDDHKRAVSLIQKMLKHKIEDARNIADIDDMDGEVADLEDWRKVLKAMAAGREDLAAKYFWRMDTAVRDWIHDYTFPWDQERFLGRMLDYNVGYPNESTELSELRKLAGLNEAPDYEDDWPEKEFNDDEHDDDGDYRGLYTDGDEDGYDEFSVDAFPDPAFGDGPGADPDVDGFGDDEDTSDSDEVGFDVDFTDMPDPEDPDYNSVANQRHRKDRAVGASGRYARTEGKWDYPKDMTSKTNKEDDDYLGGLISSRKKADRKAHRKAMKAKAHKELMRGKKESVAESYPMGMDPDNNTNVSFNQTKKIGDATLNIHAQAKDMAELQKVLQMAGLDPDGAEKHMPEPDSVQVVDVDPMPTSPCGGSTDKETLADMLRAKLQQKLT